MSSSGAVAVRLRSVTAHRIDMKGTHEHLEVVSRGCGTATDIAEVEHASGARKNVGFKPHRHSVELGIDYSMMRSRPSSVTSSSTT